MIDFAVVIPTRRRPRLLAETVESVLRQTHPATEIVIVRDGPDAEVPEGVVRGAVRVIDRPREGVAAARNAGIGATTASWLCFVDDDDLWHPERLEAVASYIEANEECAAVQAGWWSFASTPLREVDIVATTLDDCLEASERVRPVSTMAYLDITGRSFELLLGHNRMCISTVNVRRDVLDRSGGFPHGYTCAEDWVMAINVARYTEWHYLDRRLSFIRKHDGNNTTTNATNDLVTVRALRDVWGETSMPSPMHPPITGYAIEYRELVQRTVWGAVTRGDARMAREAMREGAALLPRQIDRAVVLVPPWIAHRIARLTAELRRYATPRRAVAS